MCISSYVDIHVKHYHNHRQYRGREGRPLLSSYIASDCVFIILIESSSHA